MSHLKNRISKLEQKAGVGDCSQAIIVFSDEEAQQKVAEFNRKYPEQEPFIIHIRFVKPGEV
jgi:predicted protein tyrosine phosphatase